MKLVLGSKSTKNDRLRRWLAGAVAIGIAPVLLAACGSSASPASSAGQDNNPAVVALNPATGSENSTPTWSTQAACPSGYQGSGILRAITPKGTLLSLSGATNSVTVPFKGTLLGPISEIQNVSNAANGSTQQWVVICFSGPSLTGKSQWEWKLSITYSADGTSYSTTG